MKHIFIINPIAGKHNQTVALQQQIEKHFFGLSYQIEITARANHATEIAKHYASSGDPICFYACGGDGTVHEVVNGMYAYKNARLAIVPIGTGNDFIRYFDEYTIDDFRNLSYLKQGNVMTCDLLSCNQRVCLNIASVGFDARVVQKVDRFKRLPFISGKLAYLLAVFNSFFSSMKFRYALEVDQLPIAEKDYVFVVAANGKYYGGGFHPTPMASLNDGFLDVLTIDTISRFRILGLIQTYKAGEHIDLEIVHHQQAKTLKIKSDHPVVLNMDGETSLEYNPEIVVLPNSLNLVLPKK